MCIFFSTTRIFRLSCPFSQHESRCTTHVWECAGYMIQVLTILQDRLFGTEYGPRNVRQPVKWISQANELGGLVRQRTSPTTKLLSQMAMRSTVLDIHSKFPIVRDNRLHTPVELHVERTTSQLQRSCMAKLREIYTKTRNTKSRSSPPILPNGLTK